MSSQKNIITADLFNLLYPVGSSVFAHVHVGLRQCTVISPAETISEHETTFKATYDGQVGAALVSLKWLDAAQVVEAFNKAFAVGTWLWCENAQGTYALKVERSATHSISINSFMSAGHPESIANVMGRVKWIIEFEDNGQDFIKWYVNHNNVVVDSKPYQASVWNGRTVEPANLVNGWVTGIDKEGEEYSIRYRIENLTVCPKIESEVSNG